MKSLYLLLGLIVIIALFGVGIHTLNVFVYPEASPIGVDLDNLWTLVGTALATAVGAVASRVAEAFKVYAGSDRSAN